MSKVGVFEGAIRGVKLFMTMDGKGRNSLLRRREGGGLLTCNMSPRECHRLNIRVMG